MALALYGLIPEAVYGVTSVTSLKTKSFKTAISNFIYQHIKPELLFGYELREYGGQNYQIAKLKRQCSIFYFNSKINDEESFKAMRLNIGEFKEK